MARKTKREKLKAESRRLKVTLEQTQALSTKPLVYSIKGDEERREGNKIEPREKIQAGLPAVSTEIFRDLRKIIVLTLALLLAQTLFYLTLLRGL